jgi:UDP:flavonoid glycosyltransferase YjiC (YdhE family)
MKVGIFTFGSRGDVQPYLALAIGLRGAGHDVFLCAPAEFAELAAAYDVPFRALSVSPKDLHVRPRRGRVPSDSLFGLGRVLRQLRVIGDAINRDARRLLQDAEAIIYVPLTFAAEAVARKLGVPSFLIYYLPIDPSGELAPVFTGMRRRKGVLRNRLASAIGYRIFWRIMGCGARRLRRQLGLPPFPFSGPLGEFAERGQPVFYTFSPSLLPRPSDWRPDIHAVGFVYLDPPVGWQPPPDLVRFLEAGPPPLLVGFGSMPNLEPAETTAILVEAIRRGGQRAIVQSGNAELGQRMALPDEIFVARDVPHAWLFPRVSAVMHHGGAGTTAAAFRAGVPQIVVPHIFDQPFWASLAFESGVSPPPFPAKKLSVERVFAAIQAVTADPAMRRRAAQIAATIAAEDGVAKSVRLFDDYVARFSSVPAKTASLACHPGA